MAEGIALNTDNEGWVSENPQEGKIMINSKRIEDVKGTHIVKFDSEIDSISIKHQAHSREGFALGALFAAEWLICKKGVYTMNDVLNL